MTHGFDVVGATVPVARCVGCGRGRIGL